MMHNKTILLVEDNPDDVALTLRTLHKSHINYKIVVVRDGVEALDYLFGTGTYADQGDRELPSVVLMDLGLPRLHGLEVIGRMRMDSRTKHLPVIVLTSSGREADLVASQNLRANGYIRKPVDLALFAEAVQELGLYWLLTDEVHEENKEKVSQHR